MLRQHWKLAAQKCYLDFQKGTHLSTLDVGLVIELLILDILRPDKLYF